MEYFELNSFDSFIDMSKLFIYKTTRNLLNQAEDSGAFIRSAMQALTMIGAPPSQYWPYDLQNLNGEPPAFVYMIAQNYQVNEYYRYDSAGSDPRQVLQQVKANLVAGLPAAFGFFVYPSIQGSNTTGNVPFPSIGEAQTGPIGGHAVMAVGYDDTYPVVHPDTGESRVGAILFRNSWGANWGQNGYGWLPYEYVLQQLAIDWWSIIKAEYVDTGRFGFPR